VAALGCHVSGALARHVELTGLRRKARAAIVPKVSCTASLHTGVRRHVTCPARSDRPVGALTAGRHLQATKTIEGDGLVRTRWSAQRAASRFGRTMSGRFGRWRRCRPGRRNADPCAEGLRPVGPWRMRPVTTTCGFCAMRMRNKQETDGYDQARERAGISQTFDELLQGLSESALRILRCQLLCQGAPRGAVMTERESFTLFMGGQPQVGGRQEQTDFSITACTPPARLIRSKTFLTCAV